MKLSLPVGGLFFMPILMVRKAVLELGVRHPVSPTTKPGV